MRKFLAKLSLAIIVLTSCSPSKPQFERILSAVLAQDTNIVSYQLIDTIFEDKFHIFWNKIRLYHIDSVSGESVSRSSYTFNVINLNRPYIKYTVNFNAPSTEMENANYNNIILVDTSYNYLGRTNAFQIADSAWLLASQTMVPWTGRRGSGELWYYILYIDGNELRVKHLEPNDSLYPRGNTILYYSPQNMTYIRSELLPVDEALEVCYRIIEEGQIEECISTYCASFHKLNTDFREIMKSKKCLTFDIVDAALKKYPFHLGNENYDISPERVSKMHLYIYRRLFNL